MGALFEDYEVAQGIGAELVRVRRKQGGEVVAYGVLAAGNAGEFG